MQVIFRFSPVWVCLTVFFMNKFSNITKMKLITICPSTSNANFDYLIKVVFASIPHWIYSYFIFFYNQQKFEIMQTSCPHPLLPSPTNFNIGLCFLPNKSLPSLWQSSPSNSVISSSFISWPSTVNKSFLFPVYMSLYLHI